MFYKEKNVFQFQLILNSISLVILFYVDWSVVDKLLSVAQIKKKIMRRLEKGVLTKKSTYLKPFDTNR